MPHLRLETSTPTETGQLIADLRTEVETLKQQLKQKDLEVEQRVEERMKPLAQMLKEKVEKAAKEMRQEFFPDERIKKLIAEMAKSGKLQLTIKEEGEET
ncbi:MAG: hypothetical protein JSV12_00970 [Candidatus Bathyarchaeota archaeon]|nr:MAG: hypothetical protein JSV12_00970 [Candidatus Bathyarchaeota archaeon]